MDDDYQILSRREIERLKKELKDARSGSGNSEDLEKSIGALGEKLDMIMDVFESAAEDLKEEDAESQLVKDKIEPMMQKIADIEEQNKKLAEGIVAINQIVDEKLQQIFDIANSLRNSQQMLQRNFQDAVNKIQTTMEKQQPPQAPAPMPSFSEPNLGLPPLPRGPELQKMDTRKRGFHLF